MRVFTCDLSIVDSPGSLLVCCNLSQQPKTEEYNIHLTFGREFKQGKTQIPVFGLDTKFSDSVFENCRKSFFAWGKKNANVLFMSADQNNLSGAILCCCQSDKQNEYVIVSWGSNENFKVM